MSLGLLASYLNVGKQEVEMLYQELLDDHQLLSRINSQLEASRHHYTRGLFSHESLDSVDWLAIQRIMLYILVRMFRPSVCLETGVFYGGTTCFILEALQKNQFGHLISIDYSANVAVESTRHHLVGDSEFVPEGLDTGFLVHDSLKDRWHFIRGDSLKEIPKIDERIDFYNHDSEHSFTFIQAEMELVWSQLNPSALIVADDLDWSNGFFGFCVEKRLYPLVITDNGKSGLRARTGIVRLDHPFRQRVDVVGN